MLSPQQNQQIESSRLQAKKHILRNRILTLLDEVDEKGVDAKGLEKAYNDDISFKAREVYGKYCI